MLFSLSYLNYLWTSNNQHGVHSPFVYQLLTKALYKNAKSTQSELFTQWQTKHHIKNSRKIKIINRALNYFNDSSFNTVHLGEYTFDRTLYVNSLENFQLDIENELICHPFIIVDHIDDHQKKWQEIYQNPKLTLSLDFYNIGFLFYKPVQHKENFKIRI